MYKNYDAQVTVEALRPLLILICTSGKTTMTHIPKIEVEEHQEVEGEKIVVEVETNVVEVETNVVEGEEGGVEDGIQTEKVSLEVILYNKLYSFQ